MKTQQMLTLETGEISTQNTHEKRVYRRFETRDSSAVTMTPGDIVSFCILDVSKSGIAFCYNGDANGNRKDNSVTMTLFGEKVGILKLAGQIISDKDFNGEYTWEWVEDNSSIRPFLRRCSIKFDDLSQDQEEIIQNYIRNLH